MKDNYGWEETVERYEGGIRTRAGSERGGGGGNENNTELRHMEVLLQPYIYFSPLSRFHLTSNYLTETGRLS